MDDFEKSLTCAFSTNKNQTTATANILVKTHNIEQNQQCLTVI